MQLTQAATAAVETQTDFTPGSSYLFSFGGIEAFSWVREESQNADGILRTFTAGTCLHYDEEENEFIFRGVLDGITHFFRVHPSEFSFAIVV